MYGGDISSHTEVLTKSKKLNQVPELEQIQDLSKKVKNSNFDFSFLKNYSKADIVNAAKKLLAKSKTDVPIIPEYLEGSYGANKEKLKADYRKTREILLSPYANKDELLMSFDGDGNIYIKTVAKTQNSDATASNVDRVCHRINVAVPSLLGSVMRRGDDEVDHEPNFEVNTQRIGSLPSQSILGSEGEDVFHNGKLHPSYRSLCQISGVMAEKGIANSKDPLINFLGVKGLGSSVIHKPGQPLEIHPKAKQFAEFIEFADQKHNLVKRFEDIVEQAGLRVQEYKALPAYLLEVPGAKLEDYLRLIDIAEESFQQNSSDHQFVQNIKRANIPLGDKFSKLLEQVDDQSMPQINKKIFTSSLRYAKKLCFVPHAMNHYNILDEKTKIKLAKLIIDVSRSPDVKQFAHENFGVPLEEDLVSINGRDIKNIGFEGEKLKNLKTGKVYEDFNELAVDIKSEQPAGKSCFSKILANPPNPYFEYTTNTEKQGSLRPVADYKKLNKFLIGGEDSPSGTGLLNHALLSGGAAFIARGQIELLDGLIPDMIEMLQTEDLKDHEFAVKKLNSKKYVFLKTGQEIDFEKLKQFLLKKYENKICRQETVNHNNVALAGVFLELAQELKLPISNLVGLKSDNNFKLEVDENASWLKEYYKKRNKSALETPLITGLSEKLQAEAQLKGGFKTPLSSQRGFAGILANLPFGLGKLISLERPGTVFQNLFRFIAAALIGGGTLGLFGYGSGNGMLEKAAQFIQRWGYRGQTILAGISFYLMTPHRFTLKTIGESFGFLSTLFPKGSFAEEILRPLAELNMGGIATQDAMMTNMDIDKYIGPEAKDIEKQFGTNKDFYNIRNATSKLTEQRRQEINNIKYKFMGGMLSKFGFWGDFAARIVPDIKMASKMCLQFFKVKGLSKGVFKNLLPWVKDAGLGTRMGKNCGKAYKAPHSPPHIMAATSFMTAASALSGAIFNKLGMHGTGKWLMRIANALPGVALINRAKMLAQNIPGAPTRFTDFYGKQQAYSPQNASFWQSIGAYIMTLGGIFRGSSFEHIAAPLQNIGLGLLAAIGFPMEFKNILDDAEVTQRIHQNRYFEDHPANFHNDQELKLLKEIANIKA